MTCRSPRANPKRDGMDPNVKPKTLVDTLDHANPEFSPGVCVATTTVVDICLCQLALLSVASAV